MKSPEIVVGLDIGTTKICAIVGRKNEHGKLEILGIGKAPSMGVMRGVVSNIEKTVQSIKLAVEEASVKSNIEIHNVNVGIAGQHIKSLQHRGIRTRQDSGTHCTRAPWPCAGGPCPVWPLHAGLSLRQAREQRRPLRGAP